MVVRTLSMHDSIIVTVAIVCGEHNYIYIIRVCVNELYEWFYVSSVAMFASGHHIKFN